jgi:hypothetical protein
MLPAANILINLIQLKRVHPFLCPMPALIKKIASDPPFERRRRLHRFGEKLRKRLK